MAEAGILVCLLIPTWIDGLVCPRPAAFVKISTYLEGSEDEESNVGKMPPAEGSDLEE